MKWVGTILLLLFAFWLFWVMGGSNFYYEPRAKDAIFAAQKACFSNSRGEFARRKIDAELAIQKVEGPRGEMLSAVLASELARAGCR